MTSERALEARHRAAAYRLLSRLVLDAPTDAWIGELDTMLAASSLQSDEPLAAEVQALASGVAAVRLGQTSCLELRAEHARLWSGLSPRYGPPPPYESVFREDRLPGDASVAVAAAYEESGLDVEVPDAGPADHLGNELRFMSLCALREAEALEGGREAEAAEWARRQREFLDQHLLAWAPEHCARVPEAASNDYGRAVARAVASACRIDAIDRKAA